MKTSPSLTVCAERRPHERGAALVMMLLVSMLLLAAGGALILTSSVTASFTADASSEEQAYIGAESGLQAALNVLRGNVAPNPLPTPNAGSTIADDNKINFRRAVYKRDPGGAQTVPSSNKPDDTSTVARLSRWLSYSATYPDRVPITASYTPIGGVAYSIEVTDPDNSQNVTFTTAGEFAVDTSVGCGGCVVSNSSSESSIIFPNNTAANRAKITFTPKTNQQVNPAFPSTSTSLGTFTITMISGTSAALPAGVGFKLTVTQSLPWPATKIFKGPISSGTVTMGGTPLSLDWDDAPGTLGGTNLSLTDPLSFNYSAATTVTNITSNITAPEPRHLLIRSTGYGPKGARKRLELLLDRFAFDLTPPAPIVIRGADIPDGATTAPNMTFDLGSSNSKRYSGVDLSNVDPQKPTVAVSLHDWTVADAGIKHGSTVASPQLSVLDITPIPSIWPATLTPVPSGPAPVAVTPDFLRTPENARAFLDKMEKRARSEGRYFTSLSGMAGDNSPFDPMLTFVDGNCNLDGGAGLLIVTGNLVIKGNDDFKGVIVVLGNGNVTRDGGGNGNILGAWYVGRLIRRPTGTDSTKFLAPTFDVSGGGNGDFFWSSQMGAAAQNLVAASVDGVVEY